MASSSMLSSIDNVDENQPAVLFADAIPADKCRDITSVDYFEGQPDSMNRVRPLPPHSPSLAVKARKRLVDDGLMLSSESNEESDEHYLKPAAKKKSQMLPQSSKDKQRKQKLPKDPIEKCQGKSCPGLPPTLLRPLITCGASACAKQVHRVCYERMIEKSTTPRAPSEDLVFCTLGHHDSFYKTQKETSFTWTNDGADGPSDPKCSEYYLIDWLSSEEHYMRWRDPPGSLTKQKVCEEIVNLLHQKGCRKQVDSLTIYNKIQHIEGKMRQCYDQYAGTKTGNGLKESDPMAYQDKVYFSFVFHFFHSFILLSKLILVMLYR